MITIIDYGSGNVLAIANIYKRLNIEYKIANSPEELDGAEKLILPGVGAFDTTMRLLNESGLTVKLNELVLDCEVPILGVCVGMHVMAKDSDEGKEKGLGWINASVKKLDIKKLNAKPFLPHMGWNSINFDASHPLLENIDKKNGFYFLHSFYFSCNLQENILSRTYYGDDFPCVIYAKNIYGAQFHPEKSHSNGIHLFKNFARL